MQCQAKTTSNLYECRKILNEFNSLLKDHKFILISITESIRRRIKEIKFNYYRNINVYIDSLKEIIYQLERCMFKATREEILDNDIDIEPSGESNADLDGGLKCLKMVKNLYKAFKNFQKILIFDLLIY